MAVAVITIVIMIGDLIWCSFANEVMKLCIALHLLLGSW